MNQFWTNLSERDRLMLKILGVFILGLGFYLVVVEAMWGYHEGLVSQIREKSEKLEKYQRTVALESKIKANLKDYENLGVAVNRALLSGATPELALPELNTILKGIAQKHGVEIERLKPEKSEDRDQFLEVSVSFPIRANTTQLMNFLYDIETHDKFLLIRQLQVNVTKLKSPTDFKADIVVSGLIRKPTEEAVEGAAS